MNYRETKAFQRQHHKPLRTHDEHWKSWALAGIMGLCFAAAITQWWLS